VPVKVSKHNIQEVTWCFCFVEGGNIDILLMIDAMLYDYSQDTYISN
jgi:hypothetical protein